MVDNCQHVSMACCTNLADFCRKVGVDHLFRRVPEVLFLSPEGKLSKLEGGPLPAPLHLSGSFLRANYLSWFERLRVAYGVAWLVRKPIDRPDEPFEAWLRRHGQTDRTIERYWGTVLISALNERLDQMDTGHARKVFVDGFLRNRDGYRMEIPLAPLGEIYGTRLERWLATEGVEVRLTTGVKSVELDDEGHLKGLKLRNGEAIDADFVVLASPFDRVAGFLSDEIVERIPGLKSLESIESSPITGVHLWFDRRVCPHEHVVTVGRLVQWVFDHSAIQGRGVTAVSGGATRTPHPNPPPQGGRGPEKDSRTLASDSLPPCGGGSGWGGEDMAPPEKTGTSQGRSTPDGQGQYLQVVISASYDLLTLDKNQILEAVLSDLQSIWPEAKDAKLLRSWVVTEHGATFAVRPGIDAHRPPQRTPIEGLFLAGDWTATGWPATMEGAVRSGYLAAEGILEDLCQPGGLIQPDLPCGWLARWLLGSGSAEKSSRRHPIDDPDRDEVFDATLLRR
jgi:uncharacterized protein with NAD-binding domain and iron-sulfur cluster